MSVEKIARLDAVGADPAATRALAGAGPVHGRPRPPFPDAAQTDETAAPHLYDSLVLPLPDSAKTGGRVFPFALVSNSYRTQAARPWTGPLVDGKLPETLLKREVETLLRDAAKARGLDVARLIEATEETPPERLPSRNAERARFAMRGKLVAPAEDGRPKLLDLYLTRLGPRQWEAALFERDPSRAATLFPRATAPAEIARLLIDPTSAQVLACVVQQAAASNWNLSANSALQPGALRAAAWAAIAAVAAMLAAPLSSWAAGTMLLIAFVAYALATKRR